MAGTIARELNVPVGFDTDVNAALLGEVAMGRRTRPVGRHLSSPLEQEWGGGAMIHGQVVHGLVHPEMGHLRLPHDSNGRSISRHLSLSWRLPGRFGVWSRDAEALEYAWRRLLPEDHPAWPLEARYLALALVNLTVTLSPQRILLGGGVMQQPHVFGLLRAEFGRLLNGYVQHPEILDRLDDFIQPPGLGSRAGILGCLVLAEFEQAAHTLDQAIGAR